MHEYFTPIQSGVNLWLLFFCHPEGLFVHSWRCHPEGEDEGSFCHSWLTFSYIRKIILENHLYWRLMHIPFDWISEQMDDIRVVWLPPVNKYLQLQEPAWLVFEGLAENHELSAISNLLQQNYQLPEPEALRFIHEISETIENALKHTPDIVKNPEAPDAPLAGEITTTEALPPRLETPIPTEPPVLNNEKAGFYRYYDICSKEIAVHFPDKYLEGLIHPLLKHHGIAGFSTTTAGDMEPPAGIRKEKANFAFLHTPSGYSLLHNQQTVYNSGELMNLIGKFYVRLVSEISGIPPDSWLTVCHASAVTDGRYSVMITGPSGAGKSTLTGLLAARGLSFVADDFVAINAATCSAYPFPAALSVKQGSLNALSPLYGDLHEREVHTHLKADREIRFLPLHTDGEFSNLVFPVGILIFPEYRPGTDCLMEKLEPSESLKLFTEQSWISGQPAHAAKFLSWFKNLDCYRVTYSDNDEAIRQIIGALTDMGNAHPLNGPLKNKNMKSL